MPLFSSFTSTAARALGLTNGAPPGPPVISNVTVSSVSISFNITAVLGSFTIQRFELRVNNGVWTNIGNVSSHTITGLTSSTTYTFDVRAIDIANQTSDPSILQTVTTNTEVLPGQPASVTLTQKSTTSDGTNALKLDLVFTAATQGTLPISSYQYRITKTSDSSVVIDWTTTPVGAGTTFVISGLTPSTGYTASVRAVSSSGAQGTARTSTATTAAVKLNSAPTVTYVSETQNTNKTKASITYNYGVSSGGTYPVSSYRWVWGTASETPATVSPGVNVTTIEYDAGTSVTIKVRSVDSQGNFSEYGSITQTISTPIPGTPNISFYNAFTFGVSRVDRVTLSWGAVSNATSYRAYIVGQTSYVEVNDPTRSATFSNLTPGDTYSFYVVAYNGSTSGTQSNTISIKMGVKNSFISRTIRAADHTFTQNDRTCANKGTTMSASVTTISSDNIVGYMLIDQWRFSLRRIPNSSLTCPTGNNRACAAYWPGDSDPTVGTCFNDGYEYVYAVNNATGGSFTVQVSGSGWSSLTTSCTLSASAASMIGYNIKVSGFETTANTLV